MAGDDQENVDVEVGGAAAGGGSGAARRGGRTTGSGVTLDGEEDAPRQRRQLPTKSTTSTKPTHPSEAKGLFFSWLRAKGLRRRRDVR